MLLISHSWQQHDGFHKEARRLSRDEQMVKPSDDQIRKVALPGNVENEVRHAIFSFCRHRQLQVGHAVAEKDLVLHIGMKLTKPQRDAMPAVFAAMVDEGLFESRPTGRGKSWVVTEKGYDLIYS